MKTSIIALALFCLLGMAYAGDIKKCTTREGYTYEGGLIKKVKLADDACNAEGLCKYECRYNKDCRKWSLLSYSRFGGSNTCYLHKGSAKLKMVKDAPNTANYAGICK